jgi:hypothetical protein
MITLSGPALVLKQFSVNPQTGDVLIIGRQPGLLGWLLSMMGLDATTEFRVSGQGVQVRQGSAFGDIASIVPLRQIAAVSAGFAKPAQYLILAVMTAILVIPPIVFVILYFLETRVAIMVETTGGARLAIQFKPSVIEGVNVNKDSALGVMNIINQHVMSQR